jgi:hypothetical protein
MAEENHLSPNISSTPNNSLSGSFASPPFPVIRSQNNLPIQPCRSQARRFEHSEVNEATHASNQPKRNRGQGLNYSRLPPFTGYKEEKEAFDELPLESWIKHKKNVTSQCISYDLQCGINGCKKKYRISQWFGNNKQGIPDANWTIDECVNMAETTNQRPETEHSHLDANVVKKGLNPEQKKLIQSIMAHGVTRPKMIQTIYKHNVDKLRLEGQLPAGLETSMLPSTCQITSFKNYNSSKTGETSSTLLSSDDLLALARKHSEESIIDSDTAFIAKLHMAGTSDNPELCIVITTKRLLGVCLSSTAIYCDATHSTNKQEYPVFLQCIVDSDRVAHLQAVGVTISEREKDWVQFLTAVEKSKSSILLDNQPLVPPFCVLGDAAEAFPNAAHQY